MEEKQTEIRPPKVAKTKTKGGKNQIVIPEPNPVSSYDNGEN